METQPEELICQVPGEGTFTKAIAPFDAAVAHLRSRNLRAPLTFAEVARARILAGPDSPLCAQGSFVREALVYPVAGPFFYVRESPLLDPLLAARAALAHAALETAQGSERQRSGFGEIYFGDILPEEGFQALVRAAREDAGLPPHERRVLALDARANYRIPVEKFAETELPCWAFGGPEAAREYGAFLKAAGKVEAPVWLVDWLRPDPARPPFLRQLFFGGLKSGSSFNGGRRLGRDDRAVPGTWGKNP